MFKKALIITLALMMLLCSCGKKTENIEKTEISQETEESGPVKPEEGYELGGYLSENGYWYLDFEDPTLDAKKVEVKVKLSNGTEDTSYIRRPIINVDLDGTNALTKKIKDYVEEKYGEYFKDPDDRIVKIDYETSDVNDILTIVLTEEIITPSGTNKHFNFFHYDALSDVELNMMEYSNTNGAQLATVYKAILETDWAKDYEETTGKPPYEDVLVGLVCHGDLKFDAYCTNPDGITETKLELQVEDVPLTIPDMEY